MEKCKHNLILNEERDFVFCSKCGKRWDTNTTTGTWIFPTYPVSENPYPNMPTYYTTCESGECVNGTVMNKNKQEEL